MNWHRSAVVGLALAFSGLPRARAQTLDAQSYCAQPGVLDDTCINRAGAAASVSGGIVNIPAGIYSISQQVVFYSNVTYTGGGAGNTILREAADANLSIPFTGEPFAENLILQGFTLDGNEQDNRGDQQRTLLDLTNVSGSVLQGLQIENFYGYSGPTTSGPCLGMGGESHDNLVTQNRIMNCGAVGRLSDGIYLSGSRNRVTDNLIDGISDTGIVGEFAESEVIANNDIQDTSQPITVDGLVVPTTAATVTITGNTIEGADAANGAAIYIVDAVGSTTGQITVTGNVISDVVDGHGIWVQNSVEVNISGNLLHSISPSQAVWKHGILILDSDDINITGNSVEGASGSGISLQGDTRVLVSSNIVRNNGLVSGDGIGVGDDGGWVVNSIAHIGGVCQLTLDTPAFLLASDMITIVGSSGDAACNRQAVVAEVGNDYKEVQVTVAGEGPPGNDARMFRNSSNINIVGNQSSGADQHEGLGIFGGSTGISASDNQLQGNQSPITQSGNSGTVSLGQNQLNNNNILDTSRLAVEDGIILANDASLQSVTASGRPVSILRLTNDQPSITRFIAGDDSGGFQWTNSGESAAWMSLLSSGLTFGGGAAIPSSGVVAQFAGSITTEDAGADTMAVSWVQSTSHCFTQAANARAASLTGIYIEVRLGTITLHHPAAPGALFSVFCSAQ